MIDTEDGGLGLESEGLIDLLDRIETAVLWAEKMSELGEANRHACAELLGLRALMEQWQ